LAAYAYESGLTVEEF